MRDAFDDSDEYVLVMKIRVGKRTRCVLDELREMIGPARNIIMVSEELTDDEIAALHHAADLYLSLHRAEGFALNILEALLIGKTVVATDWSANAEYGPRFPSYVPAPYTLTRYRDWTGHYPDGNFLWAEPRGDPPLRRIRERRLALAAARADLGAPPEIEPEAG